MDPDDLVEVAWNGALFKLGVIDHGRWVRISTEMRELWITSLRETIRRLSAAGANPDEVVHTTENGKELTRAHFDALSNPEYIAGTARVMLEGARYGVREFTGWLKRDGKPVPCVHRVSKEDGIERQVLAEEAMRHLRVNPKLVEELWKSLHQLQEVGASEKKA